jgi:hypothetical protein
MQNSIKIAQHQSITASKTTKKELLTKISLPGTPPRQEKAIFGLHRLLLWYNFGRELNS